MNFRRPRTRSRRNSLNFIINSEKWRNRGKRISRKDDDFLEEDSEDDIAQAGELKDWVEEFYVRKSVCVDKSDQDVEVKLNKKQTLILSTLVPDEILLIDKFSSEDSTRFVGVLLMADVSGYTALSEKYNTYGKGGTYRLTVTLNTYLGSLIEIIYSHGGDVIKFAGDAFLALWKTDKRTFINHTIHTAIACALIIQHSFGSYETDVKVNLKVKLAISAGNLIFSPIGTGIDMNYVIFGLPVLEAKAAESACASGEVKLTPSAWGHCYSRNYDHVVDANGYVTIKAILYDPHEKDVTKPFLGFGPLIRQIKKPFISIESLPELLYMSPNELSAADTSKRNEILSLRKAILQAEEKDIGSEIRKFMIRPILTQIDAHQPLEYLTEMRQVSILFITLKPRECPFSQLITIINNSYQITCEIVYKSMGCVNKIILFDKDVMILVIFGLRGFKHESEAQAALKCAYSIKKSVSALDGVLEVSIGVTTGQVYCGVVGHPLRREFTVIGAVVNKAARFMCGFRNKITCDEATYVKSKMSSNGFTLQPSIELKGINTPGEPRIGKTRLLEWMARYAKSKQFKSCYLTLTSVHSATQYLAIESPQEISRFAEYAISDGKAAGISRRRLVVGIWTYWLRVDVERKAKRFENEALNWCGNENDDGSLKTLLSALRLAEGMLESLAKKVDDLKKVVDLMELRSLADKELMRLEQDTKVLKAIGPRWLLLKANSLHLSARCNAAKATFTQALEEARKINNRLEESMILAALANSQLWIQSGKAGTFLDWMSGAVNARSSWQQIMYKINNTTRQ
ncbi:adenylate cyclase type 10-like isoform X5 [Pieris brassicae]|uniref:adenylate cyclase type 10-like isoform X5 n=1 Tax=Pieris brassicae TaxID=7116 RepID=UPI001E6611C8|nr:adenylate cyclase type 10-like isoform X5 [Pieris brassicae]